MKRVVSYLMVAMLSMGLLTACDNENKKDTNTNSSASGGVQESNVKKEIVLTKSATPIISKETFLEVVETLIDTTQYQFQENEDSTSGSYVLTRKTGNVPTKFDYKIKFGNGAEVTFPITYQELNAMGWESSKDLTQPVDVEKTESVPVFASKDRYISAEFRAEQGKTYEECSIIGFELPQYMTPAGVEYEYEGQNYIARGEYIYRLENATEFELSTGITERSHLSEIIEAYGEPYMISASISRDASGAFLESYIYVMYTDGENYEYGDSWLRFSLSGDYDHIIELEYYSEES